MAETLRIEIPIETKDNTDPELSKVTKKLEDMENAAENAGNAAKRADSSVSQFDKRAEKTQKSLAKWAKEKYQILLEAKDRISPVLSTIGRDLKSFAGRTWSVTMRAVDLVTSPVRGILNILKNPIFQAGAVLGVSIGLKDTIDTYKDFEAAMSQVKAVSGATGSDMTKLTAKAKEMGAATKFTATESAEAFNYMAMAGWKTEDMLSGIDGILNLAAASGEELATTSDIVTDALTAFGMKASESGRFADVLAQTAANANTNVSKMGESFKYVAPVAGALKYSVEDVSLALGLMAGAGIKESMAGTSLKTSLTNLAAPTEQMQKYMDKYSISLTDSSGKMKTLKSLLDNLRNSMGGLSEAEQTAAASAIFGKEAVSGMLAIVNASEADYNKLTEAVYNADGATEKMAATMMDNLSGDITLFQSAVDGLKNALGERLSNSWLRDIVQWLTSQVPKAEQAINDALDSIEKRIDRVKRKFKEISSTDEWQNADFFGKVHIAWDEFIAEPFSEWWNNTGKAKFAGFAQDIGEGIGAGLKFGIMTLLGIDMGETLDEGVSIGASFARGFSKGFDFKAVSEKLLQGFGNLFSNAGKLLPGGESAGLSSVLSAVMLWKTASPLVKFGKGAYSLGKGLFGTGTASGTSAAGSALGSAGTSLAGLLLGSTGNAMVGGSGLLGKLANVGYALNPGNSAGMYFGSTAGTMSGGAAALTGAGAVAGGVVAGTTLVSSALDAYKAFKSDNREEAKVYGESAAWKAGGVAAGAAIGSIIPGIGTAAGALIGAGVGGIVGWARGNQIKKEYQENLEEMQAKADKVFSATGLSYKDVTFKSKELNQALKDTELSTEQFTLMFQEECAKVAKEAFGDIKLSLQEVKKVAREIAFADKAEDLDTFAQAASATESSLNSLQASISGMKKENWKVGLGLELSETDKDSYKGTIENFVKNSEQFIKDNHYEATVALQLLSGTEADTSGLDAYYNSLQSRVEELGNQLKASTETALSDGKVTTDESKELEDLQNQIVEINGKTAAAKEDAKFKALQIKYSGAELDVQSFQSLQEELRANVESAAEQYAKALEITITSLELQHGSGDITDEEYNAAYEKAQNDYYEQLSALNGRVLPFNLETIAAAYSSQLENILPEIEGTTEEKLSQAMNNAILANPDAVTWKPEDVKKWFGLEQLANTNPEAFANIYQELMLSALAIPEKTKEQILENFQNQIPTVEEIEAALDWDSMKVKDWSKIMYQISGPSAMGEISEYSMDKTLKEYFGNREGGFNSQALAEEIHKALEASADSGVLSSFIEQCITQGTSETLPSWKETGGTYGEALNAGVSESIANGAPNIRAGVQTTLETAVKNPFSVNPTVNLVPEYKVVNSTSKAINSAYEIMNSALGVPFSGAPVAKNAAGGYVSGGPQLSWLAEEGYGEFVIPTNPSRRARALDLYEQAGAALGVSAHAAGGYVGGSIQSDLSAGNNLFHTADRNAPSAYKETIEGIYDGESSPAEPVPLESQINTGNSPVSVSVSVSAAPEIIIQGGSGKSEEEIMQVIRKHMREMADELGGEIAGKLEEVFSNMPLKEA